MTVCEHLKTTVSITITIRTKEDSFWTLKSKREREEEAQIVVS